MWNKTKATAKLPWQAAKTIAPKSVGQAAAYSGIAGIPVSGYFDVLGE